MKIEFRNFFKSDGYSYIEIFMVLLIVGLISTIIFTGSGSINNTILTNRKSLEISSDLLNLKLFFAKEVTKINQPWFLNKVFYKENENTIEVFYYRGVSEESLIFSAGDDGVTIRSNQVVVFRSWVLKGVFVIKDRSINYIDEGGIICTTHL